MQHKSDNLNSNNIVPKEGQSIQSDLCCNNVGWGDCPSLGYSLQLNDKQVKSFIEFARILKRIHVRLIAEGYKIDEEGNISPPQKQNL